VIPPALQEIVDDFGEAPREFRLQMLLDYSRQLPELPERYRVDHDRLERVHECQTPFFLAVELDGSGRVNVFFDAPPEAIGDLERTLLITEEVLRHLVVRVDRPVRAARGKGDDVDLAPAPGDEDEEEPQGERIDESESEAAPAATD